jgi:Kef-type K+ transport system membrane component KefB
MDLLILNSLFMNMAQIVIIAVIVYALLKKLKQPSLFAYIIAGIIIGPLVLGRVDNTFDIHTGLVLF